MLDDVFKQVSGAGKVVVVWWMVSAGRMLELIY